VPREVAGLDGGEASAGQLSHDGPWDEPRPERSHRQFPASGASVGNFRNKQSRMLLQLDDHGGVEPSEVMG
jgi:hypothetical protein